MLTVSETGASNEGILGAVNRTLAYFDSEFLYMRLSTNRSWTVANSRPS